MVFGLPLTLEHLQWVGLHTVESNDLKRHNITGKEERRGHSPTFLRVTGFHAGERTNAKSPTKIPCQTVRGPKTNEQYLRG
jgi:hypothetical protein